MKENLLEQLNDKQVEAVTTTEGPVLVIAGAGSGKTRVLTHRVAYLISEGKARPEEILTVTFTNKAANEIKQRISEILKKNQKSFSLPWSGTFHSICARILRIDGIHININQSFTIYDPDDQIKLIKEVMKELDVNPKNCSPRAVISTISSAKSELLGPKEFANQAKGYFYETVARIYPIYQKTLEENQALDFDDLIFKTITLLKTQPEIREKYQKRFKYILIDEYQDTNYSQYMLMKILSFKHKNIFVVGDDAQSIYRWRGADIRNILNFEKDFEKTTVIKLEQNYRSTQTILDATNQIIKNNLSQKPKKLWTDNKKGDPINIYNALNERDEAIFVANRLKDIGNDLDSIAVLYRTNAQSRILEEIMLDHNIPYKLVGNVRFYDRKEIKDILAYLRVIANPADTLSLIRIINTPRRGIGNQTIEKLKFLAQTNEKKLIDSLSDSDQDKVKKFDSLLQRIVKAQEKLDLVDFLKFTLEESGILEQYKDPTDENLGRIENIKEFINIATKYAGAGAKETLPKFLEDISLLEEQAKESEKEEAAKVTLMTIHSAKGLEFDYIFVTGLEENLFPHSRTYVDPDEMEEERRLAYVAFTRAKAKLFLTFASERTVFGSRQDTMISRFIEELPEDLVEYLEENSDGWSEVDMDDSEERSGGQGTSSNFVAQKGDKVRSEFFGKGTILSINHDIVKIKFDSHGVKELATEYAKLEKI